MPVQILGAARAPFASLLGLEARSLAGAAALTATFTVLGTALVPVLAIATALAFPVLPVVAVLLMRGRSGR